VIEPGIAPVVARHVAAGIDWAPYGRCPVCSAPAGRACTAMHARIENGGTAGGPVDLTVAHGSRRRRRRG
jgi:hypothetical protein